MKITLVALLLAISTQANAEPIRTQSGYLLETTINIPTPVPSPKPRP